MLKINYTEKSLEIILFKIFRLGFSYSFNNGKWCIFYLGFMKLSFGLTANWEDKPKITITKEQMFDA